MTNNDDGSVFLNNSVLSQISEASPQTDKGIRNDKTNCT